MADREKVIVALENCADFVRCLDCPWDECDNMELDVVNSVPRNLLLDALNLLKAQEPRVLTWEEVKKAEVCWLEERGYEPFATLEADTWNSEKYGKSYRCWNYMPTDEQRRAVKWDD